MVRLLSIAYAVEVMKIVHGQFDSPKLIVSPDEESTIACRNDPGPLSLVLVTVIVAADAEREADKIKIAEKIRRLGKGSMSLIGRSLTDVSWGQIEELTPIGKTLPF